MPNKFENPSSQGNRERTDQEVREAKQKVLEIVNKYTEALEGYNEDEKVIASMGTVGTSVVLEAGKLRKFVHDTSIDVMNSVGMGEDVEKALKKIMGW